MREADYKDFAFCWQQACEGTGKQPTANQIEWAFEVLKDFELQQIKRGLVLHARDQKAGQFQPKPADVIRHIEGSIDDRKASGEYAWVRVMEAMGSHGTYQSVAFDDAAIHYAIEVAFGDWVRLGKVDVDSPFPRKEFCAAYAAYRPGNGHLKYLPGILERDNSAGGQADWIPMVVFIGEEAKAKAVMNSGRDSIGDPVKIRNAYEMPNLALVREMAIAH